MIMGGSFGTARHPPNRLQSPKRFWRKAGCRTDSPPLVIDKPTSTMARNFVVDIDPKDGVFHFDLSP